jgi:hypothetical protein
MWESLQLECSTLIRHVVLAWRFPSSDMLLWLGDFPPLAFRVRRHGALASEAAPFTSDCGALGAPFASDVGAHGGRLHLYHILEPRTGAPFALDVGAPGLHSRLILEPIVGGFIRIVCCEPGEELHSRQILEFRIYMHVIFWSHRGSSRVRCWSKWGVALFVSYFGAQRRGSIRGRFWSPRGSIRVRYWSPAGFLNLHRVLGPRGGAPFASDFGAHQGGSICITFRGPGKGLHSRQIVEPSGLHSRQILEPIGRGSGCTTVEGPGEGLHSRQILEPPGLHSRHILEPTRGGSIRIIFWKPGEGSICGRFWSPRGFIRVIFWSPHGPLESVALTQP